MFERADFQASANPRSYKRNSAKTINSTQALRYSHLLVSMSCCLPLITYLVPVIWPFPPFGRFSNWIRYEKWCVQHQPGQGRWRCLPHTWAQMMHSSGKILSSSWCDTQSTLDPKPFLWRSNIDSTKEKETREPRKYYTRTFYHYISVFWLI